MRFLQRMSICKEVRYYGKISQKSIIDFTVSAAAGKHPAADDGKG